MRALLLIIALSIISAEAFAGTVTLTGTCVKAPLSSNVTFSLSNSGNDTAYNLVLAPHITGARTLNYDHSSIGPSSAYTTIVNLTNVTARGTYADYFLLYYQQGDSYFTALFPCLLSFGNSTASALVLGYNESGSGTNATDVRVDVVNTAPYNVTANVSLELPPALSAIGPSWRSISLSPHEASSTSFEVSLPQGTASYSGGAAASYVINGTNYASFTVIVVSSQQGSTSSAYDYFEIGSVAIVAAFAILIGRSLIKRRKKPAEPSAVVQ